MKNLIYLSIITIALLSCNYNVSQDLVTGMKTTGSGIFCDEIYLEIDDKKVNRTEFSYGEMVYIKCNNIRGFEKKNGAAHVGMSIKIFDTKTNKIVIEDADLFANNKAGFTEDPLLVMAKFTAAFPYKDNEKYKIKVHIWDKDGKGVFDIEMPFTIVENPMLKVNSPDIDYSAIYLWDEVEKKTIADNKVKFNSATILIFEGIDGLKEIDGLVYPGLSLELIDNNGEIIISEDNLISEATSFGVDADLLKGNLPITITFGERKPASPSKLKLVLFDNISNKKLVLTTKIIVQ